MVFSENPNREREIGIEVFYTSTKGTGGRLKVNYEDFIVDEVSIFPEKDRERQVCHRQDHLH